MLKLRSLIFSIIVLFVSVFCTNKGADREIQFEENTPVATIPFTYSNTGHIEIPVYINGSGYKFTFDTGAPVTVLSNKIAINSKDDKISSIRDAYGNKIITREVELKELTLGTIKFKNLKGLHQVDIEWDGILGNDILSELCWKIDNKKRTISIARDVKLYEHDLEKSIPLHLINNYVHVNGILNGNETSFLLDTGNPGPYVSENIDLLDTTSNYFTKWHYERPDLLFWKNVSQNSNKEIDTVFYESATVKLENVYLEDQIIRYSTKDQGRLRSSIGYGVFEHFDYVVFDYPNSQLHLGNEDYQTHKFFTSRTDVFHSKGVRITRNEDLSIRISDLNDRHKEKGLKIGDTVLQINDLVLSENIKKLFSRKDSLINKETLSYINTALYDSLRGSLYFNNSRTDKLIIKRGEDIILYSITPNESWVEMPDTIQSNFYIYEKEAQLFYSEYRPYVRHHLKRIDTGVLYIPRAIY